MLSQQLVDGSDLDVELTADVAIVGSGAAGATCARWLAAAGRKVVVVEEGAPPRPAETTRQALETLYRDAGASAAIGADVMPVLQGRCVGGTTVVNGAIQVPLPHSVWEEWPDDVRALLPWARLEEARERMDRELSVAPTPQALWGGSGQAMHAGLGGSPIRRNAPGCKGSGRCLLGCPNGAKASSDVGLLPRAMADGATVIARCKADRALVRGGRAEGVVGSFSSGARLRVSAPLVIVAASAVQTPGILRQSGVRGMGRGFMCHPGAAMAGLFDHDLAPGATQAMEDLSHCGSGHKLETLAMPGAMKAARLPGFGPLLAQRLERIDRVALWGVACRAEARGRVLPGGVVRYAPTRRDRRVLLEGLARSAEGMLRAGAVEVWPSVHGVPEVITRVEEARAIAEVEPLPGVVPLVATHLFCGVPIGERFQVAGINGLVVADSSIFPSNIGVNPMSAITAIATLVAAAWA